MTGRQTIRLSPIRTSGDGSPPTWGWQVDPADPANGRAAEKLAASGYGPIVGPDRVGEMVAWLVGLPGCRLIFEPLPRT